MLPYNEISANPQRYQQDLIARIYMEVENRKQSHEFEKEESADKTLLQLVGRLSLMVGNQLEPIIEKTLWPLVRNVLAIDTPAKFMDYSYFHLYDRTRQLLAPYSELSLAAKSHISRIDARPLKILLSLKLFELAKAKQHWMHEHENILLERLEAGFLLSGIEALWPMEGESCARIIYKNGFLRDIDELYQTYEEDLSEIKDMFRSIIMDIPVPLLAWWFKGIKNLVGWHETRVENEPLEQPSAEFEQRMSGLLLLDDLLRREFPQMARQESFSIAEDDERGLLRVRWPDQTEIGCWFPDSADDTLTISYDTLDYLSAVVSAEMVDIHYSDDEEDASIQPNRIIVLNGIIPAGEFSKYKERENSEGVFKQEDFANGHEEALQMMRSLFDYE